MEVEVTNSSGTTSGGKCAGTQIDCTVPGTVTVGHFQVQIIAFLNCHDHVNPELHDHQVLASCDFCVELELVRVRVFVTVTGRFPGWARVRHNVDYMKKK